MPDIKIRLGDGMKFNNNKITTNWVDDNVKESDGLYVGNMKGSDGADGTGSTVDNYTLIEESIHVNADKNIISAAAIVLDALNTGTPDATIGSTATLKYRDGSEDTITVTPVGIISKIITYMGYEFKPRYEAKVSIVDPPKNSIEYEPTDYTKEERENMHIYQELADYFSIPIYKGNTPEMTDDWGLIKYEDGYTKIECGDILFTKPRTPAGIREDLASTVTGNIFLLYDYNGQSRGFSFANDDALHASMANAKKYVDKGDWETSIMNDPNAGTFPSFGGTPYMVLRYDTEPFGFKNLMTNASKVLTAIKNGNPDAKVMETSTLVYDDGTTEENVLIRTYSLFSKIITRMGYRFAPPDAPEADQMNLRPETLLNATSQNFIYDADGNISNDWVLITDVKQREINGVPYYHVVDGQIVYYYGIQLYSGDILIAPIVNRQPMMDDSDPETPNISMILHTKTFWTYDGDEIYRFDYDRIRGYSFLSNGRLSGSISLAEKYLNGEEWRRSITTTNMIGSSANPITKVLRYRPVFDIDGSDEIRIRENPNVIVPIYSISAWKTSQENRQRGVIQYISPKVGKTKADIISEINFLYDKGDKMTAYIIRPNSLMQLVVIGDDTDTYFTHTLSSNNGNHMEDFNRYPDERTVGLFVIENVVYRGDYAGAITDITMRCLWSAHEDIWKPGEYLQ